MKRDESVVWRRVDAGSLDLRGMRAAIVGGTGGIGRAFSRFLAAHGARIVVVGQTFRDAGVPGIEFVKADLSLMREARRIARQQPAEELDLLILSTGIMAAREREVTAEGIERDLAVSYLNRLVMLREIAPRLGTGRHAPTMKPRVFILGFHGGGEAGTLDDLNSERDYRAFKGAHMNTVAGNEMLVLDSARRYPDVSFFGLHPGLIKTNIRRNFTANPLLFRLSEGLIGLLTPTADTYAERIAPLLVSPDLEGHSGAMFDRKGNAILPSPQATESHVKAFIAASEELLARAGEPVA